MIGLILQRLDQIVEIRIDGNNIFFRDNNNQNFVTLELLRIDKDGVLKEHPELKDDPQWRYKAIEYFRDKIKSFATEDDKMNYIKDDLVKYGFIPLFYQKSGMRPVKF